MIEIAIDGTAGAGKGTLAKNLSKKYGYPYLETGLIYRKVAFELINKSFEDAVNLEHLSCSVAKSLNLNDLDKSELRSEKTAALASKIAQFPKLRKILNNVQVEFSNKNKKQYGGCILDGRDIGTAILPKANFKFFITASLEIRAKRRLLEKNISFLHENDEKCMLQSLINEMNERDTTDKSFYYLMWLLQQFFL